MTSSRLSDDFVETPYWWEAWQPHDDQMSEVPGFVDVAVVGAGYAGLSCALELAKNGMKVAVLEAELPGIGASTLSGGQVSGGVNVLKSISGKRNGAPATERERQSILNEAGESYSVFERVLSDNAIDCDYRKCGRISALWTEAQIDTWKGYMETMNTHAAADAQFLSKDALRAELASDRYAGCVLIGRAGVVHPSKMLGGLLDAARRAGVTICSKARVTKISRDRASFAISTERGSLKCREVVLCTNGYSGSLIPELQRALVPVTSHQIATEPLPLDLRASLIPKKRGVAETRRVLNYFRYSPDGTRLLFGGRARFYPLTRRQSAAVLRNQMVDRFPQLADVRVSHSWGGTVAITLDYKPHIGRTSSGIHYALGCNGSGVVMMTYLGYKLARLLVERAPIDSSAFGTPMVKHPLYAGNPWFMPMLGSYYQIRDVFDNRPSRHR